MYSLPQCDLLIAVHVMRVYCCVVPLYLGLGDPRALEPYPLLLYRRLVVHGLYRYTRNPMFLGAFSMAFGEALIFNSRALLYYFLLVVAMQMVHVPLNEERWLRRGFGAEYEEYCRHVPRWLPRRTPYELRTKHKDT